MCVVSASINQSNQPTWTAPLVFWTRVLLHGLHPIQCRLLLLQAHRECFKEGECPKCERIRKLKEKRASSNNSPSPGT
jgi:phage FluMu protein Com